jgi:kanamycin kinase
MVSRPPAATPKVPAPVAELAGGDPIRAVWENEVGGITFELGRDPSRRFVKWVPSRPPWATKIDLAGEAARMRWAGRFVTVPRVLDQGEVADGAWLMTEALDGESAVSPRWLADHAAAVSAIGKGLRVLHDSLPAEQCPFSWSVEDRLGRLVPESRRDALSDPPPIDRLVVCHGDACSPNTLISDDGSVAGHVDLGDLGLADRWADLAIATWATEWNYGPGWEEHLLAAYGIEPDEVRTAYYRELWEGSG